MRKFILFMLFITFVSSFESSAREKDGGIGKGQIGITFSSFGSTDVISFQKTTGGASYSGDTYKTFGIAYLYQLNKTLDIETGIEYSDYKVIVEPNLPPNLYSAPYLTKFSLINIPATLRVNFLKYFFLNGGVFLGIDAGNSSPIASQNGIGANLGLGLKYNFNCGLSLFVNPYSKVHSLITFPSAGNHQTLVESGFRFGLLVRLNK